jgi:hypothetical protein
MMTTSNDSAPATVPDEDESGEQVQLAELLRMLDEAPDGRLARGVFSVWKVPAEDGGGLLLAYRLDGAEADMHLPVPAKLIDLAVSAATGRGPLGMLARIL